MSRPSLLDGQAAHQHCDTQSSDTRKDSEARELTPEVTTPVCEQKRKLNDLYVKIGRLWEENDALKENITALKEQELCDECKAKDTMIAQLEEQLYSTAVRPKNDPDPDGDAAQSGLRIAFFKAEEQLRTSNLEHAAEIARIKEEHKIIASRLHEELCAARTTAKEEQTERVHTQRQLSDTKRQLLDSEKQYQIFYDAIPKPGGSLNGAEIAPIEQAEENVALHPD
ncbi:uncharacterized protein J4E79_007055 [Alternaria viburni]|uniref:uncharacterized protein n=1 Tax=Alternaria viburni TaxID=566460 RepID=UPI0020C50EA4|nr:uncharacterized protein J4E79_007055 [Alternaria viburni]KAI4658074.1 hypothetical protein J4E79_007055 [Alternaria viburni]